MTYVISDLHGYPLEKFKMLNFDENIDYKNVNKILEKEREKSINWLIDAIEK